MKIFEKLFRTVNILLYFTQKLFKILRQSRSEFLIFTGTRVYKADGFGMQALAVQFGRLFTAAIHRVPCHRMPQIRHVNADLVRSASFELYADVRITGIFRKHGVVCDRWLGIFISNRHFFTVNRMPTDGCVDRAALFL